MRTDTIDRTIEMITINSVGQIPTLETVRTIPRERPIKLVFEGEVQSQREQ